MVDQSAFQTQGSVSGGQSTYFIKDKNGVISDVEIARDQFKPPMDGFFTLKLKGMSKPFEMSGQYGLSRNVRVALVVSAPGTANDKRMFSQLIGIAKKKDDGTWKPNITAKSASGQMIGAIRGKEIQDGEPINLLDYLNGTFGAYVKQTVKNTENGVQVDASVVKDTWQQVGKAAQAPEPEPVAVGATSGNPFMDDDD